MLSVGPTDVISAVLFQSTPVRSLWTMGFSGTIILWFMEMWKLANSLVLFSPLFVIKCISLSLSFFFFCHKTHKYCKFLLWVWKAQASKVQWRGSPAGVGVRRKRNGNACHSLPRSRSGESKTQLVSQQALLPRYILHKPPWYISKNKSAHVSSLLKISQRLPIAFWTKSQTPPTSKNVMIR